MIIGEPLLAKMGTSKGTPKHSLVVCCVGCKPLLLNDIKQDMGLKKKYIYISFLLFKAGHYHTDVCIWELFLCYALCSQSIFIYVKA